MVKRGPGDALRQYRAKRDFKKTSEPAGGDGATGGRWFVVQKHAARRLHYDLRLQFGGSLRSWAVPQGPCLDPKVRRLAVRVEDHPLDYVDFEATIPAGQYGAGGMIVWDRGTWVPMGDAEADYAKGTIKFRLAGEKLGGGWTLVRIKNDQQRGDNWLLIKERDPYARTEADGDILIERPESILTGRLVEDLLPAPKARVVAPKPKRIRVERLAGATRTELPAAKKPQLATAASKPPAGDDWLHEIKFDGYRTLVRVAAGTVRLFTRAGHDWTDRYGVLAAGFARLGCREALLDGEIVVQDERGLTSFPALQDALADGRTEALTFYGFDLLFLDGHDLAATPLVVRKQALADLLAPGLGPTSTVQLSEHVVGNGAAFFEQASTLGLEGIISKKLDSGYRSGRSKSWLKIKCLASDEFQIVGYTESAAAGGLGALLLAEAAETGLRYVGRVGTGWSGAESSRLLTALAPRRVDQPPVALPPAERRKNIVWVTPSELAEVQYGSRTGDGFLRHAVYKGLRPDRAPAPPPATAPARKTYVTDADLAAVWVTNPDRVMFGAGGPTKLELAVYYAKVGDWMLPELIRRPVSLVRCPTGKVDDSFFQRHALSGMPDAVRQIALDEDGSRGRKDQERGDYLYLENARGLLSLAQFGAVEFHGWGCRVDKPERPDRLVFDLDPDESLPWREVVAAAGQLRAALAELGLVPFVKTTGGKGLHVVVPIARRQGWVEVRAFSEAFAAAAAARAPKRFTTNMAKRQRRGRIFLDYLRNVRGATAVAAYSLRARPGAPAATPIAWAELDRLDDPRALDWRSVPARLAVGGADPWAEIDQSARPLTKVMTRQLFRD